MRYAIRGSKRELVEASNAAPRRDYTCPCCCGRVYLRSGYEREPHFAHFRGEGTVECEEYYPGDHSDNGGTGPNYIHESKVEDEPEQLGLILQHSERSWELLLRVPEIPFDELGLTPFQSLLKCSVIVSAGEAKVGTLSGIDIRPGIGTSCVPVPPTTQPYKTEPSGKWPTRVPVHRWQAKCRGLLETGSLFRIRGGAWVRLREYSAVHGGEQLVVVAPARRPPPSDILVESWYPFASPELQWSAWLVQLPIRLSREVEEWLGGLGHTVVPRSWSAEILSVPHAIRANHPIFLAGETITFKLVTPESQAQTTISLTWGSNAHLATARASGTSDLFAAASHMPNGISRLDVAEGPASSVALECERPPNSERIESILATTPRLRVQIGLASCEAWVNPTLDYYRRPVSGEPGEIAITTGVDDFRVDVVSHFQSFRQVRLAVSLKEAEHLVTAALPEAISIEINAGNLGRVELRRRQPDVARPYPTCHRLAHWIWTLERSSRDHKEITSLLYRLPRQPSRVVVAKSSATILPHIRSQMRRNAKKGKNS